ncbi:hypothetical protein TraAM80_01132 [Trypanosoma rangeli]|uniref:Uncharacterized protein n=1 Tax=Trypanosoma rangeli TaxID=5698 RepID=A0A422P0E0_TRYRA|nr:uncharacterized protein TraAM80_01132 [Trypanosoma rangeli]RNF11200.1 hypothetical protein TraAM80_01132 [Trypanosoma rangeli]|eukprot:RNF11200.1 hypothetical protein TraAM80_01132 [Trypanosoma rangeli]
MERPQCADGKIELEVVRKDGRPIVCCPIDVSELLSQQGRAVKVGDGVHVRLEEYSSEDATSSEETAEGGDGDGSTNESGSSSEIDAPPGYRKVSWHDYAFGVNGGGEIPDAKSLSFQSPKRNKEIAALSHSSGQNNSRAPSTRRDAWAAFAPPMDPERSYNWIQMTSLMPSITSRRFRLPPLMLHATASYLGPVDQGQRILVYGGTTNVCKTVEKELYEFSLLTGHWRRLEGKHVFFPGNYGHAAVVVEHPQRFVVIGGVGPGGQPVQMETYCDDFFKQRSRILFPCKGKAETRRPPFVRSKIVDLEQPTLWSLAMRVEQEPQLGFLPMLFEMDLKTLRWRVVQTSPEIPVAFHTAVAKSHTIYVFGGLTNRLLVSAQLIAIDARTYTVSLIHSSAVAPKARYLHSAVMHGNWMIIYGGFDVYNNPLDDAWAFDIAHERWELLECHSAPARAAHASCLVGSRLFVIGGFGSPIKDREKPTNSIFVLQLVPTSTGQYLWKELTVRPAVPPLAFSVACHCADDASFILYGGCTVAGKDMLKHPPDAKKVGTRVPVQSGDKNNIHRNAHNDDGESYDGFWRGLLPFNDGFVFTFPLKKKHLMGPHGDGNDAASMHVNELGVATDPEEMTPAFREFVRRQQDFILQKNASRAQTIKRTTIEELENMEPHLYFTPEEITVLLERSNRLYDSFTEYKMEMLPPNIPNRENRVRCNEECVSLSLQVRDVLMSMKGQAPGVTAVKSKAHRIKTGEKFEDYSAAKPFRRVVVMGLVKEIRAHLKRLHTLNKAIQTVEWAEKKAYLDAVDNMRQRVVEFMQAVKDVLDKYIERGVESLVSAVEKRKDKLRRLTEIVEKNRHDKIFQTEEPDPERQRVKKMWMKDEGNASPPKNPTRSVSLTHYCRRSRSIGAGYYKDEAKAVIPLQPKEVERLLKKIRLVRKVAVLFGDYCKSTQSTEEKPSNEMPLPLSAVPLTPAASEAHSLIVPSSLAIVEAVAPSNVSSVTHTAEANVGVASPSELVIRRSDAIRQEAVEKTGLVVQCVCALAKDLETSLVNGKLDSHTDVSKDGNGQTLLRLSSLRPLMSCKRQLTQLGKKVPGIRVNRWAVNDVAGAPQDEEAQKRFEKMSRCLSALVQRLTATFLANAGARPPCAASKKMQLGAAWRSVSSSSAHPPLRASPSPLLVTSSSPSSKKHRRVVRAISTVSASDVATTAEGEDYASRKQVKSSSPPREAQQQQKQSSCIFAPLSTPLMLLDASHSKAAVTPEIPRPISLTSNEAKSLVAPLHTTISVTGEGVIIPSVKDTIVIPNAQQQETTWANKTSTIIVPFTETFNAAPCNDARQPPPPHIVVSRGPTTTATDVNLTVSADLASLGGSLSAMHINMRPGMECDKPASSGMVSLSPGVFCGPSSSGVAVSPETGLSSQQATMMLEEDYFLFGRRYTADPVAAPCIVENTHERRVVSAVESPLVGRCEKGVKISPPVGALAGLNVAASRKQVGLSLFRQHPSSNPVPSASVDVPARPLRGEMFRGRLTPGEMQILQARERLRASSSRR